MNLKPLRLTPSEFCIGLGLKVLMGCLYGLIFLNVYGGDDTWKIHNSALRETEVLLSDPLRFFTEQYTPAFSIQYKTTWPERFSYYLQELEYALTVKTIAIFNVISQGNYYVNTVLFNVIIFFGHYWLFVLLLKKFPTARTFLFATIFLFLPAVFWLSGIRSDGLLFFFFSLYSFQLTGRRNAALMIIAFLGMLILRPPFAALIIPATAAYLMSRRRPTRSGRSFLLTYAVCAVVFFITPAPHYVVEKQKQFMQLQGTRFHIEPLQPDALSFVKALPRAAVNSLLRPFPWEAKTALQHLYAAEILVFWLIIIAAVAASRRRPAGVRLTDPVILYLLLFSVSLYMFAGLMVPFPGAIVRYKIIAELAVITIAGVFIKEKYNINFREGKTQKKENFLR